jgi:PAS domain S-box-containing protein
MPRRPRIRLKIKLVLAITLMMAVVVTTFSSIYLSQLVKHRIDDVDESAHFVANQVYNATREALELDLSSTRVDMNDPKAVHDATVESVRTDPGLNSLLQSIVGYSPTIYDVSLVDTDGSFMLHTDPDSIGKAAAPREDFDNVRAGGLRRQLNVIYGAPHVYEIRVPLERDNQPFGEVRVGISTVFVRSELQPQLARGLLYSGLAILASLVLAAGVSNLALRPLTTIGRRLDLITLGQLDPVTEPEPRSADEVSLVTHKIDRIDREMRDVKEVFTALKDNLEQIMANLQDGLVLFTRDARVVLVSASAEAFLGVPRERLLGQTVPEVFANSTNEFERTLVSHFEEHQPMPEREFLTESGERLLASLDFIQEDGQGIGALLTLRDAERVHRIEDEIALSHRLAATGRLVSGVGHEVKNPINAIVVHLEVLKQKLRELDPDAKRHIDVIGSEIARLDRVVQLLVDFTRPVQLQLTDQDARRLVDEVLALATPDLERSHVVLQRATAEEPLPVRIDTDLLKQAVLNVVLNGMQAMPDGGTLQVSTRRAQDDVELLVQDSGAGIPTEIQDKIFNLYFTTKPSGTGIGLAMTYKIMQLHNGSIQFVTGANGTAFSLRLPLLPLGRDARPSGSIKAVRPPSVSVKA